MIVSAVISSGASWLYDEGEGQRGKDATQWYMVAIFYGPWLGATYALISTGHDPVESWMSCAAGGLIGMVLDLVRIIVKARMHKA